MASLAELTFDVNTGRPQAIASNQCVLPDRALTGLEQVKELSPRMGQAGEFDARFEQALRCRMCASGGISA